MHFPQFSSAEICLIFFMSMPASLNLVSVRARMESADPQSAAHIDQQTRLNFCEDWQ